MSLMPFPEILPQKSTGCCSRTPAVIRNMDPTITSAAGTQQESSCFISGQWLEETGRDVLQAQARVGYCPGWGEGRGLRAAEPPWHRR